MTALLLDISLWTRIIILPQSDGYFYILLYYRIASCGVV
jgi:hypothetical protein